MLKVDINPLLKIFNLHLGHTQQISCTYFANVTTKLVQFMFYVAKGTINPGVKMMFSCVSIAYECEYIQKEEETLDYVFATI